MMMMCNGELAMIDSRIRRLEARAAHHGSHAGPPRRSFSLSTTLSSSRLPNVAVAGNKTAAATMERVSLCTAPCATRDVCTA